MKTTFIPPVLPAILALCTLAGCTSTDRLVLDEAGAREGGITIDQAKPQVENTTATLSLHRGPKLEGTLARLSRTSATLTMSHPEPHDTTVPLSQIASIRTKDHVLGAIEGVLIGGLSGYLIGLAADALQEPHGDMGQGAGIFYSSLACTAGGLVIGSIDGHVKVLELSVDTSQMATRPPETGPGQTCMGEEKRMAGSARPSESPSH